MDSLQSKYSSAGHTFPFATRQQQPTRNTQPWTTARCHRLLRPLKTHIVALRRDIEHESSEMLSEDGSRDAAHGRTSVQSWKTGRIQHTYSRRGRKSATATKPQPAPAEGTAPKTKKMSTRHVTKSGEIVLSTPFVLRARGHQISSPVQQPVLKGPVPHIQRKRSNCATLHLPDQSGGLKSSSLMSALEIEMLPLRSRISSTRFALHESILRALHALLIATSATSTIRTFAARRPSTGGNTKSLTAMCLRKVPEYIGVLEHWEQHDAEEKGTKSTLQSSEVANQVYEALEDMIPPRNGCHPLQAVVREHGMQLMRHALAEGLLDDSFSLLLVALCSRTKSYLEAEGLLEGILTRPYPKPKSIGSTFDETRRLAPLKTLRDLARESRRPHFMLRQLSRLIKTQQLPLEWLSTAEFASLWSGVVRTLSGEAACDDAVAFAVLYITSLSSQPKFSAFTLRPVKDDPKGLSQQAFLSIIAVLVSMAVFCQESRKSPTPTAGCAVSRRFGYIIEACVSEMKKIRKPGWISTALSLATYFTSTSSTNMEAEISELWHRVLQDRNRRDGKQHYEAATSLICFLAGYCARGANEPSHCTLTRFFCQLDSDALVEEGKSRNLLMDCAFLLAERTMDLRNLAFAESLSNAASPQSRKCAQVTPRKLSSSSWTGFRWDGDISEWVTTTPIPELRRTSSPGRNNTSDQIRKSSSSSNAAAQDEIDDNTSASDFEGSSVEHRSKHLTTPRRRTPVSTTRTSRGAQQYDPAPAATSAPQKRKRGVQEAGLLGLHPSNVEKGADDSRPQRRRVSGPENRARMGAAVSLDPKKRRQVMPTADAAAETALLKPRRVILRTITNADYKDMSDDELGL